MNTDLISQTKIWRNTRLRERVPVNSLEAERTFSSSTDGTARWAALMKREEALVGRDQFIKACNDIFSFVLAVGGANRGPSPGVFHEMLLVRFEEMDRSGHKMGLSRADIAHTKFALVSLIDEVVLHSSISNRSEWEERPLQMICFGECTAGEAFFDRLESVRRGSCRQEVLAVFFMCLALGFQGKFRLGSQKELATLHKSLAEALGKEKPSVGARVFARMPAVEAGSIRTISWRKLILLGLLFLGALYVGLRLQLRRSLGTVHRVAIER